MGKKKVEVKDKKSKKIQGVVPIYYYDKAMQLIREKRFRNRSDFVSYCIRFYIDYLKTREFNYSKKVPDDLSETEGKK